MTDNTDFLVPITIMVPRSTHAPLFRAAKNNGTTTGAIAARIVVDALAGAMPPDAKKRKPSGWAARISNDDLDQIRAMHGRGWADKAIADHLGRSQSTVSRQRDLLGLQPNFIGRPRKTPTP